MDNIGYSTLFLIHIISIAVIASPIITHLAIQMAGARVNNNTLAGMYHVGGITGRFSAFGGVGALLSGLIMVAMVNADEISWGKLWIWVSLVLFVAAAGIGSAILGPTGEAIESQLATGTKPDAQALARNNTFSYITIVLWVVIVFLMVFKPF